MRLAPCFLILWSSIAAAQPGADLPPPGGFELPMAGGPPGETPPLVIRNPSSVTLARSAHNAGARGDCVGARVLSTRVQSQDPEYYAAMLATDPAIVGCAARPPSEPGLTGAYDPPIHEGRPPLSSGRVAGELVLGGVLGIVGGVIGAYVGYGVECGNNRCSGELGGLGGAIIGGLIGLTTVTPLGVVLVGNNDAEEGSYAASLAGSVVGTLVGIGIAAGSNQGAPLFFVTPTIGATIGFNLSRRYKRQSQVSALLRLDHGIALGMPLPTASGHALTFTLAAGSF